MVFFTDEDIDRFVCENFPANVSAPLSSLRAGAARADLWRLLVMQRYGGVYIDFDVAVLSPLPIGPEDNVVWIRCDVITTRHHCYYALARCPSGLPP